MANQSKLLTITGWTITIAVVVFMLLDVSFDLRQAPIAVEGNAALGIPANVVLPIGLVGLACTLIHLLPKSTVFGAILLSGFLGGAIVAHIRVNGSAWDIGENILIGVFVWAGLWLRDETVRALLPVRRSGG